MFLVRAYLVSLRQIAVLSLLAMLAGCVGGPAGIGAAVAWRDVPGWIEDRHAEAWPALLQSCARLESNDLAWASLCLRARAMGQPDDAGARAFFESHFIPHVVQNEGGSREGLITGYYEPLLEGSLMRTKEYRYPIYARPKDLLIIDLGSVYEDLKGKRLRGRLVDGNRVVPYYSHGEIAGRPSPLKGNELFWVKDPVKLFFLHIQGSGRVRLPDGRMIAVGYADQNGHPYFAIGIKLIRDGHIKREEMSMQAIKTWLAANPDKAEDLLQQNPSYVFFVSRGETHEGPRGTLNVPLSAERSIAVDSKMIPLGLPVWLASRLPAAPPKIADADGRGVAQAAPSEPRPYRRLMFAQDTGGAIQGAVRADIFWGVGPHAEHYAGHMREPGQLFVLRPRPAGDQGRP